MKPYYKYLTGIFTLALLYFLATQIKFADVWQVFLRAKAGYLLLAFGAYLGVNFARTLRYFYLLHGVLSFRKLSTISFAHAFINGIMPARTGELSYVYYVDKAGVPMGANITSLFISRVFDTMTVVLFMIASLFAVLPELKNSQNVLEATLLGTVVISLLFVLFLFWEKKVLWAAQKIFDAAHLVRFQFASNLFLKFKESTEAIAHVRAPKLFLQTAAISILNWTFLYLMMWFIALGFGVPMTFWEAVFTGGLPALASIAPFYTVGNFGIFEGSKSLGMALLGFNKELAISFSFLSHITEILIIIPTGIASYIMLSREKSKNSIQTSEA